MHYELYVDSLFLVNFIMNLYLLILVDRSTLRTASPWRLLTGASAGALCFLLPFAGNAPVVLKLVSGILAGVAGMICISFRVKDLKTFLKLLEKLVFYSFGMGGAMLFLVRILRPAREILTGTFGILGVGGLVFLFFFRARPGSKAQAGLCRATLVRDGSEVTVNALIDSGNSLVEPISGKSVCVVGKDIFAILWKGTAEGFRVIPYHSIGKKRGIMPGYLLPELHLEIDGMKKTFADVYIAVSDEEISGGESAEAESVKMIINPGIFEKNEKGKPKKRQNERHYDTEGGNTGQNAV